MLNIEPREIVEVKHIKDIYGKVGKSPHVHLCPNKSLRINPWPHWYDFINIIPLV